MTKEFLLSISSHDAIAWIIAVGGDKGGVGKSTTCRVIAAWLVLHGFKIHGFDGDARNPHFERYYGQHIPVDRPPLRSIDGWTEMYNRFEQINSDTTIVLDLPGNIGDMVDAELVRLPRVAAALGRRVVSVWVASEEEDSIWLLQRARGIARAEDTLFVMNGRFGDTPAKFELWQNSKTRAAFMADGGHETLLPVLPIFPRTAIAKARSPFHDVSGAGLSRIEQIDFDMWWERVETALVPFGKILGVQ